MVGMLLAFSGVAWAATTLSNTSDPVPQPTNGRVRAVLVSDNTIYLGGSFTSVDGLSRNRLAAIDANTGQLTDWAPSINKPVRALAVSSDGTRIYAGGEFTRAGGKVHNYVAEIDATTGAVIHSWNPSADAPVYALAVLGPRVYLGGAFGAVDGQSRTRLAAVDALTGALDPQWKPKAGKGSGWTLAADTSRVRLYAGGDFQTIASQPQQRLARFSAQ
jgi:trimeric autotransporter adhesin